MLNLIVHTDAHMFSNRFRCHRVISWSKLGRHVKQEHGHEHGAAAHEHVHGAAAQHEHEHGHIGLLAGVLDVFLFLFDRSYRHLRPKLE